MSTDLQIAHSVPLRPIDEIAEKIGLGPQDLEHYGNYKAKLSPALRERLKDKKDGKFILVTAMTPTPAGEGKSTVSVGLTDGLAKIGKKVIAALREPSLGPVFGIKGGATGGGHSQVVPMEDINLHFTGDLHAITAANNLLSAMLDNHLQQGNSLNIDPRRIVWKRVLDMNDRALRNLVVGLGGRSQGYPREEHFMITAASEVMALLCLAEDSEDLKKRLGNILVAYTFDGQPVYARQLKAEGAMAMLLAEAIKPNLVQTLEGNPVLIHGGPFANIAHGCNTVIADRFALKLADYVVTEAGFASDLGAEKFFDIKCRTAGLKADAVVLVVTLRAIKHQGGADKDGWSKPNRQALLEGFANVRRHIHNMQKFGPTPVLAINLFTGDQEEEIQLVEKLAEEEKIPCRRIDAWEKGGEGAKDLAQAVVAACEEESGQEYSYELNQTIPDKVQALVTKIYGGRSVTFTPTAARELDQIEKLGLDRLPVCVAKTQYSFSDRAELLNAPEDFDLTVKAVRPCTGAGFIVCEAGDIMTMPGLPRHPAAEGMDISADGEMVGLF